MWKFGITLLAENSKCIDNRLMLHVNFLTLYTKNGDEVWTCWEFTSRWKLPIFVYGINRIIIAIIIWCDYVGLLLLCIIIIIIIDY